MAAAPSCLDLCAVQWALQQQQQQDGLRCKECASVHKHYLSVCFSLFFSSVLVRGAPGVFFYFLVWWFSSKQPGEVTLLQVYDCSF